MKKDNIDRKDAKTLINLMMRYSPVTLTVAMAAAADVCANDSVNFTRLSGVEEAAYEPIMRSFSAQLMQLASIMRDSVDMLRSVSSADQPDDRHSTSTDARDTRPLRD